MSERFLTVMGKGSISVKPDLIVMSMKLTTATPEYANTMERAASEAEALKNALISIGYDEKALKTTDFHVSMEYNRIKDAKGNWIQKFEGYKCTHSLKLEFDLDMKRLGETLTAIAACGTAPVFQIVFSVKDKNAVSAQLLENAVSNAKEKAAVLARAAGVQL